MAGEKRDFDAAAATWDESPYRVRLAEDVGRAIGEKIPLTRDMDVLEVGCGTGLLTMVLQPQVRSITGIDSSAGMLEVLASKIQDTGLTSVTTRLMDLEGPGEWEGTFDLVVSSMTFHHIGNILRLFDHVSSVVKPGGYLAVADLDKEGGKFHRTGEIIPHAGLDRGLMKKEFERAGFYNIRNCTAAMVVKPDSGGNPRCFTVFLMTGQKTGR